MQKLRRKINQKKTNLCNIHRDINQAVFKKYKWVENLDKIIIKIKCRSQWTFSGLGLTWSRPPAAPDHNLLAGSRTCGARRTPGGTDRNGIYHQETLSQAETGGFKPELKPHPSLPVHSAEPKVALLCQRGFSLAASFVTSCILRMCKLSNHQAAMSQ